MLYFIQLLATSFRPLAKPFYSYLTLLLIEAFLASRWPPAAFISYYFQLICCLQLQAAYFI
jgi:hypothetical protein